MSETAQKSITHIKLEPEWLAGVCPACGGELVSNCRYVSGRGYLVLWECAASLKDEPACSYRRIL